MNAERPAPDAAPRPSGNFKRLRARLERQTAQAIGAYGMLEPGDRLMVCLSGGKDSYTLLELLLALQKRAPFTFEIIAMNLDQKQPGYPEHVLPEYLSGLGVPHLIVQQDTYSVVKAKIPTGRTLCSLCSRLRRGVIYRVAGELGASKIALGHHRDDILATFFLNLFFGGRLKAMPPKLQSDDGAHLVIRPLAFCRERDIARYARARAFPIIPCTLCGSQENLQRRRVRELLDAWEREDPRRLESIFRALAHASPSHLLDPALFDFGALTRHTPTAEGDVLFDDPALENSVFNDPVLEHPGFSDLDADDLGTDDLEIGDLDAGDVRSEAVNSGDFDNFTLDDPALGEAFGALELLGNQDKKR